MVAIYLIRHGQASFGQQDYDQLSDMGGVQARILGKYWQSKSTPNTIYAGKLRRHKQTLEQFIQGYQGIHDKGFNGQSISDTAVNLHTGFNEFDHVDVLTRYKSQHNNVTPISESTAQQPDADKQLQITFAGAVDRWMSSKHDDEYQESWHQFKKRCFEALQEVIAQALTTKSTSTQNAKDSQDICIFTS
ncbi:MAG: broad specificity phosphatase PhoE, partial [Phenylobacterium sp.]